MWLYILFSTWFVIKMYIKMTTAVYKGQERLEGKTVIVTGANSGIGIGYVCAKDFAKRGAKVIMVCRDMGKAVEAQFKIIRETGNRNINIRHIDFASLANVRRCADKILTEEQRIDVLLNNAGESYSKLTATEDGLNDLMQVNYFGPFLFTNLLLGKIIESAPSRIVNVSSITHKHGNISLDKFKIVEGVNPSQIYSNSKLAIVYFTKELAQKVKYKGVTVNCLHPGAFPSNLMRNASIKFKLFWKIISFLFLKTTEEGAQTSIYLCVSKEVRNITGRYFQECKLARTSLLAKDPEIAKRVWDLSEDAVKMKYYEKNYN